MKVGDPTDPETYMGPLISERQRDKVDGMVQRAVAAGATLVTGGKRIEARASSTQPTLLADVDPDSEIAQDEVFGPVLAVIPHDGDDDAVRIANNSIFGLSGGVYSGDQERGIAVATQDPHRHDRRQRRHVVRSRRAVRRVQAVWHRPGDGRRRALRSSWSARPSRWLSDDAARQYPRLVKSQVRLRPRRAGAVPR